MRMLGRVMEYYRRLAETGWSTQQEAQAYCDAARIVWLLQSKPEGVN